MIDSFGRTIDYLRVSVTDQCNLRCVYCMPEEGLTFQPPENVLTDDEIVRLVRIAADTGTRKVRLTGGEPLMRRGFPDLVRRIAEIPGIADLSATTNGFLLGRDAHALAQAGLQRVNVSLDTLQAERFKSLARRGSIDRVLEGIEAAKSAGLSPLKLNCVLMKGFNDDEVVEFARWSAREAIHVRFIELMPIRWNMDDALPQRSATGDGLLTLQQAAGGMLSDVQMRRAYISSGCIKKLIERELGALEPAEVATNGPARTFRVAGGIGTVGFISQISNDLCENCNRLRLTADGSLRPCLMEDGEVDLRAPMRSGASDEALRALFAGVIEAKPERHYLAEGQRVTGRGMSQIGG